MTRKLMGLLAVLALGLLLTGGVALAASIRCTGGECRGTDSSDTMSGLDSATIPDQIYAFDRSDHVEARAGDDYVNGGGGHDGLSGQAGWDTILGLSGDDFIDGGIGFDDLQGGTGNDRILAAEPAAFGPPERDVVDCGEDANGLDVDSAHVDRIDTVKNCEKVTFAR